MVSVCLGYSGKQMHLHTLLCNDEIGGCAGYTEIILLAKDNALECITSTKSMALTGMCMTVAASVAAKLYCSTQSREAYKARRAKGSQRRGLLPFMLAAVMSPTSQHTQTVPANMCASYIFSFDSMCSRMSMYKVARRMHSH